MWNILDITSNERVYDRNTAYLPRSCKKASRKETKTNCRALSKSKGRGYAKKVKYSILTRLNIAHSDVEDVDIDEVSMTAAARIGRNAWKHDECSTGGTSIDEACELSCQGYY